LFENKQLIPTDLISMQGSASWESPSNIALIKYWGKYGRQMPANPSLSMTLSNSKTCTKINYGIVRNKKDAGVVFRLDGQINKAFGERIQNYLISICDFFPFLCQLNMEIESKNTFPHSAGIASSASGMSALALCLCSIENQLFLDKDEDELFFKKASYLARLASGSACRSIYGGFVSWGKSSAFPASADEYGTPYVKGIHPVFMTLQDSILIIEEGVKKVSSSLGHSLMQNHSYSRTRFKDAKINFAAMLNILKRGEFDDFADLVEYEALSLHAMMMTSRPGYLLMRDLTLLAIEKIRNAREQNGLSVCFTLDAGANVHLIYPESEKIKVMNFIEQDLKNSGIVKWIEDRIGSGPVKIL